MSAEDLDKLFRDKLKNNPVAPSNDTWARLQARMQQTGEEATPNPFLVPPSAEEKEERKPIMMWYYSAVAAAVTLLLTVGLWLNRDNLNLQQATETVATVQTPAAKPKDETSTLEPLTQKPVNGVENLRQETETQTSAQPQQMVASASKNQAAEAKTGKKEQAELLKKGPVAKPRQNALVEGPSMMASTTPAKNAPAAAEAVEPEPLEIIVKLDNSQATTSTALASTTITDTPDEEEKPSAGRVMKNIFKQVKNLKDGEKISREELGIPKHTFALETRIGNKRISKTIEL
ncbi:hypothetical protein [Rufibacter soli]